MSLSLLILIFLFKNIEAHEGCGGWVDGSKIYECIDCDSGYKKA